MRTETELNRVSSEIIGAAMAVHQSVGPGCFESAYTPCLAYELQKRGLTFAMRVPIEIRYQSLSIPRAYEADFIVQSDIVVELKATANISAIDARQLLTYLRFTGCPLGLLLNFGALTLLEGIKRVVNNFPEGSRPPNAVEQETKPREESQG